MMRALILILTVALAGCVNCPDAPCGDALTIVIEAKDGEAFSGRSYQVSLEVEEDVVWTADCSTGETASCVGEWTDDAEEDGWSADAEIGSTVIEIALSRVVSQDGGVDTLGPRHVTLKVDAEGIAQVMESFEPTYERSGIGPRKCGRCEFARATFIAD